MTKIRIKDIAKAAGVSAGTVDRVIHKRGNVAKIAEKRVQKAILKLNYKPNLAARVLANKKNFKVAIFIPSTKDDEFWKSQVNGVKRALRSVKDFGFTGDIIEYNDQKEGDLLKHADKLVLGSYEAVLLAPVLMQDASQFLDRCKDMNIPFVQINTFIKKENQHSLGYVGQNSFRSGQLAAKLLDLTTAKDSSLVTLHMERDVEHSNHLIDKQSGFESYFKKSNKRNISSSRLVEIENPKSLRKQIDNLLKNDPLISGFFITTSRVHFISKVLIKLKREDITLVGFDLIPQNQQVLNAYKRLFLINQNPSLQGYYGVRRLFDFLVQKRRKDNIKYLPLDVITLENVSNYLHIQDRDSEDYD